MHYYRNKFLTNAQRLHDWRFQTLNKSWNLNFFFLGIHKLLMFVYLLDIGYS